jgi:fructosamine-3-kinase
MQVGARVEIEAALGGTIVAVESVAGGDINDAYRVELADGRVVFVKLHADAPVDLFAAEADGLAWLCAAFGEPSDALPSTSARSTSARSSARSALRVPRVHAVSDGWLALEWLELRGQPDPERLGAGLAKLHRAGAPCFGYARPNFLATLPQDNTAESDWPTFYVERRLRPLCRRAHLGLDAKLDALRTRSDRFGPVEPPARLHGDLWWGNVGALADGAPVIIDPAVYGGHREIDLAMLALFGGLPDRMIAAYEARFPLAAGWRDRIALHQLYPLAAHACLFGGGYGTQVASTLARLV